MTSQLRHIPGESARPVLPDRLPQNETLVMGVVNVTPDSFSDGGEYQRVCAAVAHGRDMAAQGAAIIDVGGQSTRPGAADVSPAEESERILPVIAALAQDGLVVSADTLHAGVAAAAVEAGASIINDVSGGLADPQMADVVAETRVPYICQHWRGNPQTMDSLTEYPRGVLAGIEAELDARLQHLFAAGATPDQVILDPGLGFAKTQQQSWEIVSQFGRLASWGFPVLIGASRKRFLAAASAPGATASQRDAATAAVSTLAALAGLWGVRVHDVASSLAAVRAVSIAAGAGRDEDGRAEDAQAAPATGPHAAAPAALDTDAHAAGENPESTATEERPLS